MDTPFADTMDKLPCVTTIPLYNLNERSGGDYMGALPQAEICRIFLCKLDKQEVFVPIPQISTQKTRL